MYSMFVGPWILGLALLTGGNVDQAAPSPPPSEKPYNRRRRRASGGAGRPRETVLGNLKIATGNYRGFLSDDHVEVGFGGVIGKAAVVAGVGSPICVVRSYSVTGLG